MHTPISSSVIILDTLVKSTLLLAIAWGAALILKRRSAATQHMVRTFALAALLLLPFSVMLLPVWHIKGLPQYPKSSTSTQQPAAQTAATAISGLTTRNAPAAPLRRSAVSASTAPMNPRVKTEVRLAGDRHAQSAPSAVVSTAAITNATTPPATISSERNRPITSLTRSISAFLPKFLLGLWVIGALFFLARWR